VLPFTPLSVVSRGLLLFTAASICAATLSAQPISIRLERVAAGPDIISFGLPLARGAVSDASRIRVRSGTTVLPIHVTPLLSEFDAAGNPIGLRAVLIQFASTIPVGGSLTVSVTLDDPASAAPPSDHTAFAQLSFASSETADVVDRTIVKDGGTYRLAESNARRMTLFTGREPAVLAHLPDGYLAHSGILGPQVTAVEAASDSDRAGLKFLSDNLAPYIHSSNYEETFALNPAPDSVVDPVENFEGWLYDRCTTHLTASSHLGDPVMLRHALRTCS